MTSALASGPRDEGIDFTKGVLIVLVTVGHVLQLVIHRNVDFWDDPVFKGIYMFHMPLFMAVSGYLARRGVETTKPVPLAWKRARNYVVPIFSWAVVAEIVTQVLGSGPGWRRLPAEAFYNGLKGAWFLWAMYGAVLVAALAHRAGRWMPLAWAVLTAGVMLIPDFGSLFLQHNLYLFQYTLPFFAVGYLVHGHSRVLRSLAQSRWAWGIGLALCTVGYVGWHRETYIYVTQMALTRANVPHIAWRWGFGLVASAVALGLFWRLHDGCGPAVRRAFVLAGRDSLYIYLLQGYALAAMVQHINPGGVHWLSGAAWAAALGVALSAACWIVGTALSRNRWLATWMFGRLPRSA